MDLKQHLLKELVAINQTFVQHGIRASCHASRTVIAGSVFISYGVKLAPGTKIVSVENLIPELSETITKLRGKPTPVRAQRMPFSLETPHPQPQPMQLNRGLPTLNPHEMLLGRSFNPFIGGKDEICRFDDFPHTLIGGTTGAGKSTLLNWMILSLCRHTSPLEMQLLLIDLKNEDLLPYQNLPHTALFANDIEGAAEVIHHAYSEVRRRVSTQDRPYRLLLIIDELAELASEKRLLDQLGRYLGLGRSKWCNAIVATQYPTAEILGRLGKANIPHRLGGLCVDTDTARLVSSRAKSYLHLLPGQGSFMRIHGNQMTRMQSYFLERGYRDQLISEIKGQWSTNASPRQPDPFIFIEGKQPKAQEQPKALPTHGPTHTPGVAPPTAPALPERIGVSELSDRECLAIHHALDSGDYSRNKMQKRLYGNTGSAYRKRLNTALSRAEMLLSQG